MRGRILARATEKPVDVAATAGRLVQQERRHGVFMSGAHKRLFPNQRQFLFEALVRQFDGEVFY